MKPWNANLWKYIDDVEVTDEDINTAIYEMSQEGAFEERNKLFETIMLSATVIAYMRALMDRGTDRGLLARIVCNELPIETGRRSTEIHGLIDPADDRHEREILTRNSCDAAENYRKERAKFRNRTKH